MGIPLTGMKLIDSPASGERIHQARHAPGTLTVRPSTRDPLNVMEPAHEIAAQFLVADIGGPQVGEPTLTTDIDQEWIARNVRERSW